MCEREIVRVEGTSSEESPSDESEVRELVMPIAASRACPSNIQIIIFCLGSRVSGFGFRVSGFGFQVSGLGLRVWGLGSRVSGLGFRV